MKLSTLIFGAAMALIPAAASAAQSDCHRDLKDMLEGTLEIGEEAQNRAAGDGQSGCTLAFEGDRVPLSAKQAGLVLPVSTQPA